ncbi:MAG: ATP synthase subunit C [Firmicutes bacterium]|nr:ATP synthase subunit C [Bacillota bacterium]
MGYVIAISTFLVLSMIALGITYIRKGTTGKNAKTILGVNVFVMFGILIATTVILISGNAAASQEAGEAAAKSGLQYLAAALATGLATIGTGIAVAVASSAALGAISEDPKLLGKTLIFVGLGEGIAIYGLIVSILILYG